MTQINSQTEEWQLAQYLVDRVCDRASGSAEPECCRNYPRDVYFIGNLRPREDGDTNPSDGFDELLSKLAPVAFGADFAVEFQKTPGNVKVVLSWACYYRVFPTWHQQQHHQGLLASSASPDTEQPLDAPPEDVTDANEVDSIGVVPTPVAIADQASAADRRRARRSTDSLFLRFRKIICRAAGTVQIQLVGGQPSANVSDLQDAVNAEIQRAQSIAQNDLERMRTPQLPDDRVQVPSEAVINEQAFTLWLASLRCEAAPKWNWGLVATIRPDPSTNAHVLGFEFTNATPQSCTPGKDNPNIEPFLFDVSAKFAFVDVRVLPFTLELAPRGFRYDRYLWGRGFNCAVNRDTTDNHIFITTHAPVHQQMRFVTRDQPRASFTDLETNPIPTLEAIARAMSEYRAEWTAARQRYVQSNPDWESEHGAAFSADAALFEDEILRFERGLQLIRDDADVRLAFTLTNQTFRIAGVNSDPARSKTRWRLFQIVFLVTQLPGISALKLRGNAAMLADREVVDIIYFPTGGGKTEAYLGALVFHCFFDRLRGKTAGVTAWTRFPLRLLTLQQTQRMADIIGAAELVRRSQTDPRLSGPQAAEFAVGYFVGQEATPNEITNPQYAQRADPVTWSIANDATLRQRWRRVITCPSCRTKTVSVDFDPGQARLMHRCSNSSCRFPSGIIPVYVVDNEIYRYLPTIIVGTIDKLAGMGNQRKLSMVFGRIDGRCRIHGFYKGKCCQKDCTDKTRLQKVVPSGISGPTMFVQDELHLLKEGLGTFDSHYETFTQQLLREFGQGEPAKIIASSATIEAFDRQVEHLYGRTRQQSRVFPGPGPALGDSFYASTLSYPQRLFVGILPHNKTIFNAILELLELYHREWQALANLPVGTPSPFGGTLTPGSRAWQQLLDLYKSSLTYFLAGRELNSIHTDLEGDVNPNLIRDGLQPLSIFELTGNTSTDEVTRVLERLETGAQTSEIDTVLATSMVSHGVDVDRLNAMVFYGMPRQNAEYIQASSRVGRSHVGIILDCLHPARERDQSHYAYFRKFHEYLGQMVEPVAINRWAKFSINRTLPGLFMGVLLQVMASADISPDQYYMLDFVRRKITDGSLNANNFIDFLEQAYQVVGGTTPAATGFRDEIRLRVQQFLDSIVGSAAGSTFVSDVLMPRPMRSLRDVDDVIEIELDTQGSQWAGRGN